ncbi:helix-turn-helix domain-containing protein [Prauserella alba]|uniref:helix-turn-helix domain-containing protein n=1 Tax=Prauserella alba TaxID=176898 RepID=UPI003556C325
MTVGPLLRAWRTRRRLSQLGLSAQLRVSARHVSFVETGRSGASRAWLPQLAEHLDVPLRPQRTVAGRRIRTPRSASTGSTTGRWNPCGGPATPS